VTTSTVPHGSLHTYDTLLARLRLVNQEHVLRHYPSLSTEEKAALLAQLATLELEALPSLIDRYVTRKPVFELPPGVKPAPYYSLSSPAGETGGTLAWDPARARAIGEDLLKAGKVAAFVVAGGQGSRLGYEGPKGCYPAGAVSKKPLFQMFAEQLLAVAARYGKAVPWYIMTSPLNHDATVAFFKENRSFGLSEHNIKFLPQGALPSLDIDSGRMLMSSSSQVATNPDGHGGSFRALWTSGAVADMKLRGVEHISYFQVDNPIVRVVDPVFLGLHADPACSSAEMSSKMIPKAYPEEKLGLFCSVPRDDAPGDRIEVIEYSDLPMHLQSERLADGSLRFLSGSIAVHILGAAFVERVSTDRTFELPFHRAEKKIPTIDPETGAPVTPQKNNGVKLERFVFDALPMCARSIVLETDRVEEFAPIKNATGIDSVESSRDIQTARAARWLEAADIKIPRKPDGRPDCTLEIDPRTALDPADLRRTPPQSNSAQARQS